SSGEIASQIDDTERDGAPDLLTFVTDFVPKERKRVTLHYTSTGSIPREYRKRTQAELGIKVGYTLVDGKYVGGKFIDVDSVRVPLPHVDHDNLFRHEGPGWESGRIGYRLYLDERNRTDIFGKKIPDMVLDTTGVHDLAANNNESYESMLNWGMDIFKVGASLGIGSIAMLTSDGIESVSKTDSVFCIIAANGPVRSDVRGIYDGWNISGKKYDLVSDYSITAGSRMTKVESSIRPIQVENRFGENLCTGLAKHEHTVLVEPPKQTKGDWYYLGLYGQQSLSGDGLGIAIFYRVSDFIKRCDNSLSYAVALQPHNGKLTYYFAAAWQQESGGIKNAEEFQADLDTTIVKLDSPIEISY
ncbi:MAG: DUF4861 family protein, partial [Bacteroidota bacterium]|nr:DUF4861 family protein [Bacteroidota bacterium]